MAVELAFLRTPTCGVESRDDAEDPVRRKKAVVYSGRKAVSKDRLAEVPVGVDILRAPRRRRHADLGSRLEILEDVAPTRFVSRAPSVTLVHDDQVEVIRRILAVETRPHLILRDGLVEGEINLPSFLRLALDFPDGVAEDRKLSRDRLVNEDVSIGEVQSPPLSAGLPQLPDDLDGCERLPGTRRHREEDSPFTFQGCPHSAVDRDRL